MLASFRRFASTVSTKAMAHPHADGVFPPINKILLNSTYEAKQHAVSSVLFWKRFNLFVTLPTLIIAGAYVLPHELEHIHHLDHEKREFIAIPYLRKRKSQYPWGDGDHTLFSHPNANPGPN